MQVFLTTRILKATLECAAKSSVRFYLETICLDFDDKKVTYCSCDGNVMKVWVE